MHQGKKNPKHKGYQRYCMLYNEAGIPKHKYKLHSSETFFGWRSDQESIKEGLWGSLCNRATDVKHYQKYEKERKRDLKYLRKQNNILFSMSKRSGSRCELNKTKKICAKAYKKYD